MTQSATKALGRRIKSLRQAKGWTQARLAETLGVEPMTISRYERGSYAPSVEGLEDMAQVLGCAMSAFFSTDCESPIPSQEELRHALCDIAYRTDDLEALAEMLASARKILARSSRRKRPS